MQYPMHYTLVLGGLACMALVYVRLRTAAHDTLARAGLDPSGKIRFGDFKKEK